MMKVLGIDPGLKATGYGVLERGVDGRITALEAGSIEPSARLTLAEKLLKIHKM